MKMVCVPEWKDGVARRKPVALGESAGLRSDGVTMKREAVEPGIADL